MGLGFPENFPSQSPFRLHDLTSGERESCIILPCALFFSHLHNEACVISIPAFIPDKTMWREKDNIAVSCH